MIFFILIVLVTISISRAYIALTRLKLQKASFPHFQTGPFDDFFSRNKPKIVKNSNVNFLPYDDDEEEDEPQKKPTNSAVITKKDNSNESDKVNVSKDEEVKKFLQPRTRNRRLYELREELSKMSTVEICLKMCGNSLYTDPALLFPRTKLMTDKKHDLSINRYIIANPLVFLNYPEIAKRFDLDLEALPQDFTVDQLMHILPVVYIALSNKQLGLIGYQLNKAMILAKNPDSTTDKNNLIPLPTKTIKDMFPFHKYLKSSRVYTGGSVQMKRGSAFSMIHNIADFPDNRPLPTILSKKEEFSLYTAPDVSFANELISTKDATPKNFKFMEYCTIWNNIDLLREELIKNIWILVDGPVDIFFSDNSLEFPLYKRIISSLEEFEQARSKYILAIEQPKSIVKPTIEGRKKGQRIVPIPTEDDIIDEDDDRIEELVRLQEELYQRSLQDPQLNKLMNNKAKTSNTILQNLDNDGSEMPDDEFEHIDSSSRAVEDSELDFDLDADDLDQRFFSDDGEDNEEVSADDMKKILDRMKKFNGEGDALSEEEEDLDDIESAFNNVPKPAIPIKKNQVPPPSRFKGNVEDEDFDDFLNKMLRQ